VGEQIIIPSWLARGLVPSAILLVLAASLVMWRDVALMGQRIQIIEPRLTEFEHFRLRSKEFETRLTNIERRLDRIELIEQYDKPRKK